MEMEKNENLQESQNLQYENDNTTLPEEKVIQDPLPGGFKAWKNPIDRKDKWIMLLISIIYAVVAYVNLGSFTTPETQTYMENPVILQLEKSTHISDIRYYAGIGEGTIEFEYSSDGLNYTPVKTEEGKDAVIEYQNSNMYVYRSTKTDIEASYIRIDVLKPGMNINEIAVIDSDGNLASVQSASLESGDASGKYDPANLIDEQDLVPANPSYMDEMYFDEIYHGRTAYEDIHHMEPYEITHPPLGKVIMTIGINIFGMTPFGWRCVGTLFGVLVLPIMYIFAKSLFREKKYAVIAAVLFAVDFMHFSQTRIGTIDSYSITWIMLMTYFMYRFTQCNFNFQPLKKTLLPLFLSGLFFGIGAGTKWLCIYAGAGLLVVFVYTMLKRRKEYKIACKAPDKYAQIVKNYKKNVVYTLLWCILFFIIIPGVIYVLSYKGYWHNNGEQWGLKDVIANQKYMLNYHANLHPANPHPFASMWYTWPLDIRPLLFYSNQTVPNVVSTMSTMGNPFIWIGGLISGITLTLMAIFKKYRSGAAAFLGISALSQIVPWVLVTREVFIYHYFATTPFLILILTLMLKHIDESSERGRRYTTIFVIVCVAAFAAFYPVISGTPVPQWYINMIRWLPSWPFY
jgi:dolichyl-phosphate-mannose-protein mannosyltransferase